MEFLFDKPELEKREMSGRPVDVDMSLSINAVGLDCAGIPLVTRWMNLDEHVEDDEGENDQNGGWQKPFPRDEIYLIGCVAQKTLEEKLPSDHYIPPHGENTNHGQNPGEHKYPFASHLGKFYEFRYGRQADGSQRAQEDLDSDLRKEKAGVHHEVETAEGFVSFIDAMDTRLPGSRQCVRRTSLGGRLFLVPQNRLPS